MDEYYIHPGVFYRQYPNVVVVYNTSKQKVYTFNDSAGAILDCFKEKSTPETAINTLANTYKFQDYNSFCHYILNFVDQLTQLGILIKQYQQTEKVNNLEKEISSYFSSGEQLYSVTFELTYRCNEKCRHCYVVNEGKKEISFDTIKNVLDQLYELNVFNIVFTGGEIFTRNDAFDILEYAYKKRFIVDIFTNGNLIDGNDYIRLKNLWPRCVHFSLYSHIPEKHDAITQVKGSFEKTVKSIKSCVNIGIPTNIKTPIFNETLSDVTGIVQLANDLGCSVELGRNISPKKNGDLSPLGLKINTDSDQKKVKETINSLIQTLDNNSDHFVRRDKICGAGERTLSINPYGSVFPCNMFLLQVGDIYKQSIKEIWENSEKLKWWRAHNNRELKEGCSNCKLTDKCVFCPGEAMMWTGNPLARYDSACETTELSNI